MPNKWSGISKVTVAKPGFVMDGDLFTGAATVLKSGATATLTQASTTTTLTGGAGFVSGDTGKYLYISGAATSANNGWQGPITYVSATSVTWTNASGATDANNGHIAWAESTLPVSTLAVAPATQMGNTAFTGPPVRTGVGTWTVTTRDNVVATCDFNVDTVLAAGQYLTVQENTSTTIAATGQRVYNWTFNVAGTATDLPFPGQFRIMATYADMKASL